MPEDCVKHPPYRSDFLSEVFRGFKVGKRMLTGAVSLKRARSYGLYILLKKVGSLCSGRQLGLRNGPDFICPDKGLMRI